MTFRTLIGQPSAFVPLVMSALALGVVAMAIANGAARPEADENAYAHVFQLLIAGQIPFMARFVLRWGPGEPKRAMAVLALQLGSMLMALAPVRLLGL